MRHLFIVYHRFIQKVSDLSRSWTALPIEDGGLANPFGTAVLPIFARPQPMSGFGAECKRLISHRIVRDLDVISREIDRLRFSDEVDVSMEQLLKILEQIARKAKRIGDAQRAYFQFAFRALLLPDNESYLDLSLCWLKGQEDFEMMY